MSLSHRKQLTKRSRNPCLFLFLASFAIHRDEDSKEVFLMRVERTARNDMSIL